jgi:hypothetical protein
MKKLRNRRKHQWSLPKFSVGHPDLGIFYRPVPISRVEIIEI